MKALCKCGHDGREHGLFGCDICGCSRCDVLHERILDSDRIRKQMMQLAAAEAEARLHTVAIQPAVDRTA
jgi:predicted  nucleic acid-binding Zn-ribbon protein